MSKLSDEQILADNMRLPEGKLCGDCFHWKRCSSLIDDLDGTENTCDFAPSRFREKASHD